MDKVKVVVVEPDSRAAKLYGQLETVHAQVFQERGGKRKAAVNIAAQLVDLGYSLRKAAKVAGRKPDNKLQRYFEVAKAMLAHEAGKDGAIPPPEGFETWTDAVAGMALEALCTSIRERKPEAPVTVVDYDKAVRGFVNKTLDRLQALTVGEASKALTGVVVGEAQLQAYVKAWLRDGMSTAKLDKNPLTAITGDGAADLVTSIRAALQASLGTGQLVKAPAQSIIPAVVNG
jgi:hypothetical protein